MSWEDTFKAWSKHPSATEREKMEHAEIAIKKAIKASPALEEMDISIIPQGSYRSRTNVRLDSDVDICLRLNSTFFPRYPAGKTKEDYGNVDGSISFRDFRDLVHSALGEYFGYSNITPGSKAFDIHSNSYRVDADVVPSFAYRYYPDSGLKSHIAPEGMAFDTSTGARVINWPHQTYENGIAKHERTGRRYRKMVRILKRLRNDMQNQGIKAADDIASFLIESAVYNVPDDGFNHSTYTADVRYVIANCFNTTQANGEYQNMWEVNEMKRLFGNHQPWSREQAHKFFSAAWEFVGFK